MEISLLKTTHHNKIDYKKLWLHINSLKVVSILATGRTGSDFLQSLLENHDQILTFNGHFLIYSEFFNSSITFKGKKLKAEDIADELIGRYIYKFATQYDIQEGKDRLGPHCNQSFNISTPSFKTHFIGLLLNEEITSKNILLAIYGAYNLSLSRDILNTKVFLHHPHLSFEFLEFLKDFPNSKAIFTTRDPRACLYSIIENFRTYFPGNDNQEHFYNSLKMILEDNLLGKKLRLDFYTIRLEDMPHPTEMRRLASWLDIDFQDKILRSTWAGLDWYGDRLSPKKISPVGWSADRTSNAWKRCFNRFDILRLNVIMYQRLNFYKYPVENISKYLRYFTFLFLWLPFGYELDYIRFNYLKERLVLGSMDQRIRCILFPIFYARRVSICYKHFFIDNVY